jgi:hypothetical protein
MTVSSALLHAEGCTTPRSLLPLSSHQLASPPGRISTRTGLVDFDRLVRISNQQQLSSNAASSCRRWLADTGDSEIANSDSETIAGGRNRAR